MNWTVWILMSACFLALYDLAKKASVRENAVLPVLLGSTCCGCAAFLVGLAVTGRLATSLAAVDARVLVLGLLKALIVSVSWIFTFCALRTLPITIATPIRASAPALVFLVALFVYGEVPTVCQGVGMLAVFLGYWAFSWAGRHEGIDFLRNHAVWCAIAGMAFSALSALFDKFVFQVARAPVEPTQLVFQVGLILVYAIGLLASRAFPSAHAFSWRWTIPLVGVLLAVSDACYFNAVSIPDAKISVLSMIRRSSVVLTFFLGGAVFHETNLLRKAAALAAILVGVMTLCLAK